DRVDVDEMRRARETERHAGDEALAAGEDASVLRRKPGEHGDGLIDGARRVIDERRRFHRSFRKRIRRLKRDDFFDSSSRFGVLLSPISDDLLSPPEASIRPYEPTSPFRASISFDCIYFNRSP